jgi:alpha-D-xyloside xylohydrolase
MLNSNAIDVVASGETLTWRLAGGQVDLFVLSGPTPALVAQQLASLVGLPTLQPPWAFGAMNSKYGYASAAQCRAVVDSFDGAGVPLEAWVSDSQYMSGDRIFTWGDDFSKSEMRDFVKHLRATGDRRWVPILDPVVRAQRGYSPFDEASADGGIFLEGADGKPYLGQMWPGAVHWPDFLDNPSTQRWWTRWLRQVREDVGAIDGAWLDMNEVSNFCSGDVCRPPLSKADPSKRIRPEEVPPNANFVCLLDCEFGPFEKKGNGDVPDSVFAPPYSVNSAGGQRNLSEKTLPVSARHPKSGALEYDAHNLYGHSMARATFEALSEVNRVRPFLFTRSSFLGTGAFSGHWTGDTSSSWRDLRRLTPSVLLSGLALIPFVGGDVGGFMNGASSASRLFIFSYIFMVPILFVFRSHFSSLSPHSTRPRLPLFLFSFSSSSGELAERWIAAAALHPFFRFHHAQGFQEPFRRFAGSSSSSGGGNGNETQGSEWGPVRDAARSSLGLRYRLLPTLYSAAAQAAE